MMPGVKPKGGCKPSPANPGHPYFYAASYNQQQQYHCSTQFNQVFIKNLWANKYGPVIQSPDHCLKDAGLTPQP